MTTPRTLTVRLAADDKGGTKPKTAPQKKAAAKRSTRKK